MALCLVVDDSDVIRLITRKILEKLGQQVTEAGSVSDALQECAAVCPDVVFLDWDLPSLGALDFLKGVSELNVAAKPKIILCATENDAKQFALARAAGAAFHILKPYDFATVQTVLEEAEVLLVPPSSQPAAV